MIAIPASGKGLDADVDKRFGRCPFIILYDLETGKFNSYENPYADEASGAGVKTAEFISKKGAKTLYALKLGPKARQVVEAAGIEIITGVKGRVDETLNNHIKT
ncbi:MAG: NifB/NifX family molybdenum-iron cluster-binding protein [Bacillota bacterium]